MARKKKSAVYMLSVDPADHGSGVCLWYSIEPDWQAWKLIASTGTKKGTDQVEAINVIRGLLADRDISGESCILVIETWMIQRCRGAVESLAANQRMWISAVNRVFEDRVTVYKLNSQTWMSRAGILSMRTSLGSTKAATAFFAAEMRPGVQMTEDEADAVVMGAWWLKSGGPAGHEQRKAELRQAKAAKKARKADRDGKKTEARFRQLGLI